MAEASYTRSLTMGDNNANCGNTIGSFNKTINKTINQTINISDEDAPILQWLSPLGPRIRHQDIRNQRVDSVGDWLLETKEFRSWYNSSDGDETNHAVLFCYGNPGVGKSYISSVVVDYLCDQAIEQDMSVACFYYDFASREEQSPTNMLGTVLKQLLIGLETIPPEISRKFRGQKKVIGGRRPQLPDIVKMYPAVSSLKRTFICADALDECAPKHRLEVLDALGQLLRSSPNTRIFMTGRPYIRGEVEREFHGREISVSIKPKHDDVVTFLREKLRKDTTPEVKDSGLENDIMKIIPEEISETFLLVSLKVEAILRETTIHRRRKRLNTMGDGLGLGDAYDATMERIRAQDGEKAKLAMATLMWICHSERALRVEELCHALAVEIGSTYFNSDNVPEIETLLVCCQGLVTVDKEASTVRLIHHTLHEYLSAQPNLFGRAHSTMAETCLTYLNSDQVMSLSTKPEPDLSSMPFLKYCSRYWGVHTKRGFSSPVKLLAMQLLNRYENHISARLLLEIFLGSDYPPYSDAPSISTGLHCASFFGIVEIMSDLLGAKGYDASQRDLAGATPLIWAAQNGQDEAVKLLLGQEAANPDFPDKEGNTPLSWAAYTGHDSIVKLLLEQDAVNPDFPDKEGRSPLSWAAYNGHNSVVKLLLEQQAVSPDLPDNKGRSPLSRAAISGQDSVVKLLLALEAANPDFPDKEGRSPLSRAAIYGHGSVVKLLLEQQAVNPGFPDNKGRLPLSYAAINGHDSVVKLLLEQDAVNPDFPDKEGRSPLSWAAISGHDSVIKLLLEQDAVNPDFPDKRGRSPLSWAAVYGHDSVVKLLLEQQAVNPDFQTRRADYPSRGLQSMGMTQ